MKGSFFKQRRFWDEEDLRRQLGEWLTEVNEQRPCRATKVIPAQRLEEERWRLRPVQIQPEDLALRIPVSAGPTDMVRHDAHDYSMPAEAMSVPGTLYLCQDRVRIVAGGHEALHPRLWEPGARSLLPEDRSSAVAAVSGKRAWRYLKREHPLHLGPETHEYLTELVHRPHRVVAHEDLVASVHSDGPNPEIVGTFAPTNGTERFLPYANLATPIAPTVEVSRPHEDIVSHTPNQHDVYLVPDVLNMQTINVNDARVIRVRGSYYVDTRPSVPSWSRQNAR